MTKLKRLSVAEIEAEANLPEDNYKVTYKVTEVEVDVIEEKAK